MTAFLNAGPMPAHTPGETYSYPALDTPVEPTADQLAAWQAAPTLEIFADSRLTGSVLDNAYVASHPLVEAILDEDGVPNMFAFRNAVDDHRYGRSATPSPIADVIARADALAVVSIEGMGRATPNWGEFTDAAALVILAECVVEPATV